MSALMPRQKLPKTPQLKIIPLLFSVAFLSMTGLSMTGHAATPNDNADNTAVNTRDSDGNTLTPLDQSNSKADTNLVANIRSALTSDESLSVNAQNVKVIVREGVATLRGPVANGAEKSRVEKIVKSVRGVRSVTSEIEAKD